jgi:hypothetical protein
MLRSPTPDSFSARSAREHQIADAGIEAREDDADTPAEAVGISGNLADRHDGVDAVARRRAASG